MSNLIQIKRSLTTASPVSLANGELAYTANGDILYIGSNGAIVPIGGARTPGTLTANQALVANATSGIDKVITGNAVITTLWANGAAGSNGQVLVTNGSAVYWGTGTSGSNTYIQFNDSGVANGVAGFTFDKVSNTLFVSNAVLTTTVNAASHTVGTSTIANSAGFYTTGTVNAATIAVGSNFIANSTNVISNGLFSGNGAGLTSVNAATVGGNTASTLRTYSDDKAANAYANATSYAALAAANAYSNAMADTLSRNGSYTGNNIFGGTNTVISSNLTISGAAVYVNGSITFGDTTSDTINPVARYANNIIPSANVTYDLGTAGLRWNTVFANTVNAISGNFSGNVSISGDLTVTGNLTTTNVSSISIADPLIYLAVGNESSDTVDIGLVGHYYNGAAGRHTGIFRDHTDGLWKVFDNTTQDLTGNNDVNTGDATYRTATLVTYLNSGALTTNTTAVAITANSTVSVSLVANTLSLSTPLAGTSGGTGLNSYTAEDILVANSSNGFRKLGIGTSGYVLQSNGSALVYDVLDGGSF